MIPGRLKLPSGSKAQCVCLLTACRKDMAHRRFDVLEPLVECPDRDVTRTRGEELAQAHLFVGVRAHDAGACGEAAGLAQVRQQRLLVSPHLGTAVELSQRY